MNELVDRIREFIINEIGWAGSAGLLTPDYPLIDNKVIDSVAAFEIISFVEDEYDIEIDNDELTADNLQTLARIQKLVEGKVAVRS